MSLSLEEADDDKVARVLLAGHEGRSSGSGGKSQHGPACVEEPREYPRGRPQRDWLGARLGGVTDTQGDIVQTVPTWIRPKLPGCSSS